MNKRFKVTNSILCSSCNFTVQLKRIKILVYQLNALNKLPTRESNTNLLEQGNIISVKNSFFRF